MEKFAAFIRTYRRRMKEMYPTRTFRQIKVALIDDGVDGLNAELSKSIEAGQTFSIREGGNYNSYFTSSKGHGTIMAMLIRKICPNVRLYVAKLDEERTGRNSYSITAWSAVKV
jgi:subtilisin family serine protease